MNPDDIYNDEMVGLSLGRLANLALNPVAQTRAALGMMRGAGSALARAAGGGGGGGLPPPPQLSPNMRQASASPGGNTIHAYMGMGKANWTGTDASSKPFSAEPQSSFIGNRLVIAARYSSGASGSQVVISAPLTVSGMPQTPAPAEEAPIEMFKEDVTYSALDLEIATSATQITFTLSIDAAVGTSDKVNVAAGLYGQWIR
jgi:hypothetical protein